MSTVKPLEVPNISRYLEFITKASKKYNVPKEIIASVIYTESRGNPDAWNGSNGENSRGLMQISEATAQSSPLDIPPMMLTTLFDPEINIDTGTKYLRYIWNQLEPYWSKELSTYEKWLVVVSSYNQGWGYYKKALETIEQEGDNWDWPTIEHYVLNPILWNKTPWRQNVLEYGHGVMERLSTEQVKSLSSGTGLSKIFLIAGVLLGGIYFMSKTPRKTLAMRSNPAPEPIFHGDRVIFKGKSYDKKEVKEIATENGLSIVEYLRMLERKGKL